MTVEELKACFEQLGADDATTADEYLQFDRIEKKRSCRPDLHAFIVLDELVPGAMDMVTAAEHDRIYLDVELEDLAPVVTVAQLLDLYRCGVFVDEETDSLTMFA